jgi:hypothetical protein
LVIGQPIHPIAVATWPELLVEIGGHRSSSTVAIDLDLLCQQVFVRVADATAGRQFMQADSTALTFD